MIHQSVTEHINSILATGSNMNTEGLAGSKSRFLGTVVEEVTLQLSGCSGGSDATGDHSKQKDRNGLFWDLGRSLF